MDLTPGPTLNMACFTRSLSFTMYVNAVLVNSATKIVYRRRTPSVKKKTVSDNLSGLNTQRSKVVYTNYS